MRRVAKVSHPSARALRAAADCLLRGVDHFARRHARVFEHLRVSILPAHDPNEGVNPYRKMICVRLSLRVRASDALLLHADYCNILE